MILFKNELYRFRETGELRRILWVSPNSDQIVSIRVDAHVNAPKWSSSKDWEPDENGKEKVIPEPDDAYLRLNEASEISAPNIVRRDKAWKSIKGIVCQEPEIYRAKPRGEMQRRAAKLAKVSNDTIRNYTFEYWQRGMTKHALRPDWPNCGNRGERKKAGEKKRGRPRNNPSIVGINVDEDIQKIFEVAINNKYNKNKKMGLKGAYNEMMKKWFSEFVTVEDDGEIILDPEGNYPTYEVFHYWYKTGRNERSEAIARKGKKYYERNLRALVGNSTSEAIGPGFRYQIDATIADVYLVSSANGRDIIGRPVVYVVIDVWSRMIVGIYVGLENASWLAAKMALLNVGMDKVEFCKKHGISITADQWPAVGYSDYLLADKGEGISQFSEQVGELGIKVENAPAYRPDWKGIVERMFGVLPAKFSYALPGYIEVDYKERGGRDYRLDATLTLDDFTELMIMAVLDHNSHIIKGYPLTGDLIKNGVPAIPNELWAWGIKNRMGKLRTYPERVLRFGLMHTDDATLTGSGIEFRGRTYKSNAKLASGEQSSARRNSKKVRVAYDPICLGEILLHEEHSRRRFEVCPLRSDDPIEIGLSLQELLEQQKRARETTAGRKHKVLENRLNFEVKMEATIESAKARKAALEPDNRSKAERTGNIRVNKAVERDQRRKGDVYSFSPKVDAVDVDTDANSSAETEQTRQASFKMPTVISIRSRQQ
ncbi:DDE-type integrase/transposase/recombinase [Paraburkholderia tropica]|uniref:DDE-type integrase/transposase/recombinase n=1 Tax=Paraburkholderia tropica TaxID=92647 RepID=UPI002ABE5EEB|nr:DDE-type integrase/transposase/recombinase [Paraburkholderia tropica]